ncbi:MAG: immunoglobulin domain-containing protein, partial [Bacteroidales bacterium]|nr:immunoglobulin domain-containing protein [Bacteroidales bacterium]
MRIDPLVGSYNLGIPGLTEGETYYIKAYATNAEGTSYGNELSFTTLITPAFASLGLNESVDMTSWSAVGGNLSAGFQTTINPTINYYYLDINNAVTQTNVPLQTGAYAGFSLTSYPAGFMAYWDAKGVNSSAAAGSWQATMWQIINGNLPIFFIRTNTDGSLSLVDGLMFALGMPDELLKVNGDYPLGTYTFQGVVSGQNGVMSQPVVVSFAFNGLAPQFTAIAMSQSLDKNIWEDVAGSLAAGFSLLLDSTVTFYYLDLKNPQSQTNIPLSTGYYGFNVSTYPAGFFAYWDGRGVNAAAQAGTWQATMWQIVNGNLPIFYVKAMANGDLTLVDGLQYALGQPDDYLRISGDYPEGNFTFTGTITGVNGVVSPLHTIPVTVTRQCIPPVVMAGPSNLSACVGSDVTFSMVVGGSTPFSYQWKYNGTDITGETGQNLTLQNITLTDAGNYSCYITNDCGNALSPSASLTVNQSPIILTEPILANVYAGISATFSITAQHAVSYQWQLSPDGGQTWADITDGAVYTGTTTTTLNVLSPTLMMNGYHYRCIVSGLCAPADISQAAPLLVTLPVSAIITTAPHLTANTGDTVVVPIMVENFYGVSAISLTLGYDPAVASFLEFRNTNGALAGSLFFANNTGNTIKVQWLSLIPINLGTGTLIDVAFVYHGGSTPLVWQLQPLEASQYGNSQALPFAAIWNNGSINPASGLTINAHPVNQSACNGAAASFSLNATGATAYTWQMSANGGLTWSNLAGNPNYIGTATATLQIPATNAGMNNNLYRCQVTDGTATLISGAAFLFVTPWANLAMPLVANPGLEVCNGTPISFSIPSASALTNPSYTWFLNGTAVGSGTTYTLSNPADGDVVSCTLLAVDDCAAVTSIAAAIEIDPLPVITQQPINTVVYQGDNASFSVTSPNSGSYQWQVSTNGGLNWTNLSDGPGVIGSQAASLNLQGVTLGMNNNRYRVLLTEANCGETLYSGSAILTVKQLPVHTFAGSAAACPGDLVVIP